VKLVELPRPGGLGRLVAPDDRDRAFPMRALLAPAPPSQRKRRMWSANGWWGDQGDTEECVAYAWTHYLEDAPRSEPGPAPCVNPLDIYHLAQQLDEFPGENYDGTSVRGGAKALAQLGYIGAYHWATTVEEVAQAILQLGPVVLGLNWYTGMFHPDAKGFVKIAGSLEGGHATCGDGVDVDKGFVRIKNSWGRSWGLKGFCYLGFDDLARLLSEQGEACIATKQRIEPGKTAPAS
jgi:hypothetical protein